MSAQLMFELDDGTVPAVAPARPAPTHPTTTSGSTRSAGSAGSPGELFLTGIARVFAAVETSATFAAAVETAHASARDRDGRAEAGNAFEAALAAALTPDAQAAVHAETAATLAATLDGGRVPGFPAALTGLTWHYIGDRKGAPADFMAHLRFADRTVLAPVNAKYNSSAASGNDAVSVANLLRVALGRELTDSRRINVERTLLEWFAGQRRIARADYLILSVRRDPTTGQLVRWHFQGLLSTVSADGTRLAISRNTKREGVLYDDATRVLPDDMDVNARFAEALAPRGDPDAFKLALLSFLSAQGAVTDTDRAALARQLLDTSPAELADTLTRALTGTPAALLPAA